MNQEELIFKIETLEKEKIELEKIIVDLKKENLYFQSRKTEDKIKIYNDENFNDDNASHIFKNHENIKQDDMFFTDVLFQFYDQTIELLDKSREGTHNDRNIFSEMINLFNEYHDFFSYYISDIRLNFIDKSIEDITNSDLSFQEKVEEYYNKIYYEIFIEFLPLNHSFTPTN